MGMDAIAMLPLVVGESRAAPRAPRAGLPARPLIAPAAAANFKVSHGCLVEAVAVATCAAEATLASAAARRGARRRSASGWTVCSALPALQPPPSLGSEISPETSPLRFSRLANWVAPGHLMVGRYPLTDPDKVEGQAHLRQLVSTAGVSTFVCLQSEVPDQLLGRWPAGGIELHGRRCLPYARMAQQFATGRKLNFLYEPIDDLTAPGLDRLEKLVEKLQERISRGETLFLHCWGGRGRSGMLAGCLLGSLYGLDPEEVLRYIQLGYDSRGYDNCVSPETSEQRELVRLFCARRLSARSEAAAE